MSSQASSGAYVMQQSDAAAKGDQQATDTCRRPRQLPLQSVDQSCMPCRAQGHKLTIPMLMAAK